MYHVTSKTFTSGLPGKVKVGPIIYEVVLTSKPTTKNENGEEIPVFGMVDFKNCRITIDDELHPAMQWQCFFHELMHILFATLGLEDPGEGQDDALAYTLMDFMLDNGFLVEGKRKERDNFPSLESSIRSSANQFPRTMEKEA